MPRPLVTCAGLTWSATLLLFALHASPSLTSAVMGLAIIVGTLATIRRPMDGLFLLPFPALMGPIYPADISGLGSITAADFHLLVLSIAFVFLHRRVVQPVYLRGTGFFLQSFALALLFSWALSEDVASSTYAVASLSEIAAVFILTLNLPRSSADVRALLHFWLAAVSLCSLLVIVRYAGGQPLLLSSELHGAALAQDEVVGAGFFFRATFFYAGFFFLLAVGLILILIRLVVVRPSSLIEWGAFVLAGFVNGAALLLMNTKSAIFALVLTGALILVCACFRRDHIARRAANPLTIGLTFGAVGGCLVYLGMSFVPTEQVAAFVDRFLSGESLMVRVVVYGNALMDVLGDAKVLLVGLGPDTIVRAPQLPQVSRMLTDPHTGLSEGALDSTYLALLVEFGLPAFLILNALVIYAAWKLIANRRRLPADLYWTVLGGLAVWMLTAMTQYTGWSKTSWLFVELVALARLLTAAKYSLMLEHCSSREGTDRPDSATADKGSTGRLWSF